MSFLKSPLQISSKIRRIRRLSNLENGQTLSDFVTKDLFFLISERSIKGTLFSKF